MNLLTSESKRDKEEGKYDFDKTSSDESDDDSSPQNKYREADNNLNKSSTTPETMSFGQAAETTQAKHVQGLFHKVSTLKHTKKKYEKVSLQRKINDSDSNMDNEYIP